MEEDLYAGQHVSVGQRGGVYSETLCCTSVSGIAGTKTPPPPPPLCPPDQRVPVGRLGPAPDPAHPAPGSTGAAGLTLAAQLGPTGGRGAEGGGGSWQHRSGLQVGRWKRGGGEGRGALAAQLRPAGGRLGEGRGGGGRAGGRLGARAVMIRISV